ncbi:SRPBCC family protein [Faecalibacter macacae]|uniref:SRPBCC family protein n=1 Tax=Faecalibacter macacae TaxID=1859289 RepID=A0A3L9MC62_9FLAO|nr:hypothetical protein [Faecalibacter macacae]RLZ10645.1 hypothetical protein EAH69_05740 [Faecalibacter macacae]
MNFKYNYYLIPIIIGVILLSIGVKFIESYGIAIFLILPFFIGALTTILLKKYRPEIYSLKNAIFSGFANILVISLAILLVGIEGLICIFMASPILLLFIFIGAAIAHTYVDKIKNTNAIIIFFSTAILGLSFAEKDKTPSLSKVKTSIIINAPIEKVWENVVVFPQLEEPTELLFKAGIAYPINATIEGEGVGAIRYCNFTTGSFVEPITTWNAPTHLAFDVLEQPEPMKEISYWNFDAAHLHDYFVSKNGEFRLKKIDENTTELTGTTWYTHKIYPEFYWRIWSDEIIHLIHNRVLTHIKKEAEK